MSYELATKRTEDIKKFGFQAIIADEIHYLKSRETKRTKNLGPLMTAAKRVILLSGTPVLAKPVEIYNVLKILRPDITPVFTTFADRYCNPTSNKFGIDYSGAACT